MVMGQNKLTRPKKIDMKAIMIIYNQAHTEKVEYLLEKLGIKGFSLWENVQGRGTNTGVPHLGTHAWPEINKSVLTIVDDGSLTAFWRM